MPEPLSQDMITKNMQRTFSLEQFSEIYVKPHAQPSTVCYIFRPFVEVCQGWKQETFNQVLVQITKKNLVPIPTLLYTDKEMGVISNKSEPIAKIF